VRGEGEGADGGVLGVLGRQFLGSSWVNCMHVVPRRQVFEPCPLVINPMLPLLFASVCMPLLTWLRVLSVRRGCADGGEELLQASTRRWMNQRHASYALQASFHLPSQCPPPLFVAPLAPSVGPSNLGGPTWLFLGAPTWLFLAWRHEY
jgi:hypothetical protein